MYKAGKLSQNNVEGLYWAIPISRRMKESQASTAVVDAIARYSASALDQATMGCFLALHEMQLEPKKVQYPVVERLVVVHPAQSASEKAKRSIVLLLSILMPR